MVVKMRWAIHGLTALAASQLLSAMADVQNADVWIGFPDNQSGFLVDEASGAVWMTGPCLKALEPAYRVHDAWISHTVELGSSGRGVATRDQRFELQTDTATPSSTVTSNGRGGAQAFSAIVDRDCRTGGTCADLIETQQVCKS